MESVLQFQPGFPVYMIYLCDLLRNYHWHERATQNLFRCLVQILIAEAEDGEEVDFETTTEIVDYERVQRSGEFLTMR